MTNKKYLFNEAENHYVNQLKTVETIARELNLCRKTVMLWKESGDWDRKKLELHKARMTIHEKMYKFAQKLLNDIIADIDAGNKVDASRMYTFNKLIASFEQKGLTPDVIAKIEQEILGIPPETETEDEEQQ